MKGKLLRGITGSVQPRRLLHGYQDAVFAWSGEEPFANLAQSDLYRILPRTQYSDSWIKSTPHGQAFRANNYSSSGHGYVFSSHVPNADQTYSKGVTGYAEFVYSANLQSGEFAQHLCCISSSADGNTGDTHYGILTFGLENHSGLRPVSRIGNNTRLYGSAGGSSDNGAGTLVLVSIPVGAKVRQMVTFDPVSKAYYSIIAVNDSVYEASGTVPNGFASTGSTILIGGYPRSGIRAAYVSGMLEAAIWNRGIPPAEMRALLQRPSIFQPAEFIFPFSFGESSGGGSEVINTVPEAMALSSMQAGLITTEILNASSDTLILAPVAAQIVADQVLIAAPASLVLSPAQAVLRTTEILNTSVGSLSMAQTAASLHATVELAASPAGLVLGTSSATFAQNAVINAQPDALVLSPAMAGIYAGEAVVATSPKAITLTPDQATIVQHGVLATTPDNIDLHGVTASLSITGGISIQANPAIISLSGVNAGIDIDSGSVNFGTTNTSRYFISDAMAGMDLSGDFSIVAVISPDYTVSNRHKYFFSTAASTSDPAGLNLYITSNDGFLSLLPGSGSSAISSAAVPPGWCLVYARRIAGSVSVGFVDLSNGTHTKSNTPSSSGNFSNDVAAIGGRLDLDATRFYTGGMSWIALLETGLSDGQIESIAAGTTGLLNDFEPSVVELWDMTYNRPIQPGVVHGINAQRFGDGWGAGGGNPLPYEIADAEIISAIPATIGLSGVNAAINLSGQIQIPARAATIALGGVSASLNGNIRIGSIPAEIRLSGVPFSLDEKILAHPANLGISGQKADISMRTMLAANPASMILASMRAHINYQSPLIWGGMTIEARLQGMTIEARQ